MYMYALLFLLIHTYVHIRMYLSVPICTHTIRCRDEVISHLSKLQDQAHFYPLATARRTLTVGLGEG
jgi:hypothetical protein